MIRHAVALLTVVCPIGGQCLGADCWFRLSGHACTECPPPPMVCAPGWPQASCPQTQLVDPQGDSIMVIRKAWSGHSGWTNKSWFRDSATEGQCKYLRDQCHYTLGCQQTEDVFEHPCPSKLDPDPSQHPSNCMGAEDPP